MEAAGLQNRAWTRFDSLAVRYDKMPGRTGGKPCRGSPALVPSRLPRQGPSNGAVSLWEGDSRTVPARRPTGASYGSAMRVTRCGVWAVIGRGSYPSQCRRFRSLAQSDESTGLRTRRSQVRVLRDRLGSSYRQASDGPSSRLIGSLLCCLPAASNARGKMRVRVPSREPTGSRVAQVDKSPFSLPPVRPHGVAAVCKTAALTRNLVRFQGPASSMVRAARRRSSRGRGSAYAQSRLRYVMRCSAHGFDSRLSP
jgi:hypothetical protein